MSLIFELIVNPQQCHQHVTLGKIKHIYFVFALVTPAERALHSVAALYSYLSPHNNTGGRLFGALHDETTAGHAESRGNLGQDLWKRLKERKMFNVSHLSRCSGTVRGRQ